MRQRATSRASTRASTTARRSLREGDYFGSSVNLAARLLNDADRDELVATRQAVDACPPERNWESRGTRRVRGFAEPVELYLLAA